MHTLLGPPWQGGESEGERTTKNIRDGQAAGSLILLAPRRQEPPPRPDLHYMSRRIRTFGPDPSEIGFRAAPPADVPDTVDTIHERQNRMARQATGIWQVQF